MAAQLIRRNTLPLRQSQKRRQRLSKPGAAEVARSGTTSKRIQFAAALSELPAFIEKHLGPCKAVRDAAVTFGDTRAPAAEPLGITFARAMI
jgi:hypothetical protein